MFNAPMLECFNTRITERVPLRATKCLLFPVNGRDFVCSQAGFQHILISIFSLIVKQRGQNNTERPKGACLEIGTSRVQNTF